MTPGGRKVTGGRCVDEKCWVVLSRGSELLVPRQSKTFFATKNFERIGRGPLIDKNSGGYLNTLVLSVLRYLGTCMDLSVHTDGSHSGRQCTGTLPGAPPSYHLGMVKWS